MGLLNNVELVMILNTVNFFNGMVTIPWDFMDKTMQTGKMVKEFIVIPVRFLPLTGKKLSLLPYLSDHLPSESFFQSAVDAAAEMTFQLSEEADHSFPTLSFILLPLPNSPTPWFWKLLYSSSWRSQTLVTSFQITTFPPASFHRLSHL